MDGRTRRRRLVVTALCVCHIMSSSSARHMVTVLCVCHILSSSCGRHGALASSHHNVWTVHVRGDAKDADELASRHNFINKGQVANLKDHYAFTHQTMITWSSAPANHLTDRLLSESKVIWAEQQFARIRRRRAPPKRQRRRGAFNVSAMFNDVSWPLQWYLGKNKQRRDMNVVPVWRRGYTGRGVVVTILDDGIEYTHDDLKTNYDSDASYDVNDDDPDPLPRYEDDLNRHGTRCAGEVAAAANNSRCIVGVAYNARIGGVRMLDGSVTDLVEATSFGIQPQHVDIYSASWGPNDDGATVDGPGNLGIKAMIQGIKHGRGGKGSIFVWASGNGGSYSDSCACDGYSSSIFTITISSATMRGTVPFYLEECAAILSTTYSSGNEEEGDKSVVTTTLHNGCTMEHSGTSASAPLASGIIALALEANKNITWRDIQHIIVRTSQWRPLVDGNFTTNGAGRKVSHRYGFGVMDADAMVKLARRWTPLPNQNTCIHRREIVRSDKGWKPYRQYIVKSTGCANYKGGCPIRYLEQVQLKIKLAYPTRGEVHIHVTSPSGTRSVFLPRRPRDHASTRYYRSSYGVFWKWPLMSTHYWGESPKGNWTISIYNTDAVGEFKLIMHGTSRYPYSRKVKGHRRERPCQVDFVELYTFPKVKTSSLVTYVNWSDYNESSVIPKTGVVTDFDIITDGQSISWPNITVPVVICLLASMAAVVLGICKRLRLAPCYSYPAHHESSDNLYDGVSSSSSSDVTQRDDVTMMTSTPLIVCTTSADDALSHREDEDTEEDDITTAEVS